MSWRPNLEPASAPGAGDADPSIAAVIEPRNRDLGDGFSVRRLLPAAKQRAVGPFVFFDHFGPTHFAPGKGMDVRPHPHINLATVTYLFDGEIVHRDSLGSCQAIRPGDVNWMTAGRGIVHSERIDPARKAAGSSVHGLQLWVALPKEYEETSPEFHHHPGETLPEIVDAGVQVRVLAGEALGLRSPVRTFSPLLYLDVRIDSGAELQLPDDQDQRAVYVIDGSVMCDGRTFAPTQMFSLRGAKETGRQVVVRAEADAHFVVIGGAPLAEPRHLWWNFVSSSPERIELAKRDWSERRGVPDGPFPLVPGDEREYIPLPLP